MSSGEATYGVEPGRGSKGEASLATCEFEFEVEAGQKVNSYLQ